MRWLRWAIKIAAQALLSIGLLISLVTSIEILHHPQTSKANRENALGALTVLGLPPTMMGSFGLLMLWPSSRQRSNQPRTNPLGNSEIVAGKPVRSEPSSNVHWPGSSEAIAPPKSINDQTQRRLELFQLLSSLPGTTFNAILYGLSTPPQVISARSAPQGHRVAEWLNWVQSPVGCGLGELEAIVEKVVGDR